MKRWQHEGSTDGIVSQVMFVMQDGYLLLDIRIKIIRFMQNAYKKMWKFIKEKNDNF
jgi:hypothetical protein